jgi:hypothetical protein
LLLLLLLPSFSMSFLIPSIISHSISRRSITIDLSTNNWSIFSSILVLVKVFVLLFVQVNKLTNVGIIDQLVFQILICIS